MVKIIIWASVTTKRLPVQVGLVREAARPGLVLIWPQSSAVLIDLKKNDLNWMNGLFPLFKHHLQQPGAQPWEGQTESAPEFTSGPQRAGASQLRLRWPRPLSVRHTDITVQCEVTVYTRLYLKFFCIHGLFTETQVQTFSTLRSCSTACHYSSLSGS